MSNFSIEAKLREDMSKSGLKALRNNGCVTATVSGGIGKESLAISVDYVDLVSKIKESEAGQDSVIELKTDSSTELVKIRNFFRDPVSRKVLDIEFIRTA